MILGREFLKGHGAKINFGDNTLAVNSNTDIRCINKYTLQPKEICLIKAAIGNEKSQFPSGLHGVIRPCVKLNGIRVLPSTTTVSNDAAIILLQNVKPWPIKLKRNSKLSSFFPLSCAELQNIDGNTIDQADILTKLTNNCDTSTDIMDSHTMSISPRENTALPAQRAYANESMTSLRDSLPDQ